MRVRKPAIMGAIATLLASSGLVSAAAPASAACEYFTYYSYSGITVSRIHAPGRIVYGQSGVLLNLTSTVSSTVTGTIGGSGTYTASAVVSSAAVTVSTSISKAKTYSIAVGGSWRVPATQANGWLADGAQGRKMSWRNLRQNGNCTFTTLASGTANLPTLAPYIFHS